jgi:hypothetical protein
VSLFRRREPLHVRLLREGARGEPEPSPRAPWDAAGIHGVPRAREWDLVRTVEAPGLSGERAAFVCVAPGQIVVEEGPSGLEPLAAAVEAGGLAPPFRAEAVRRKDSLWAVAARKVELVSLPDAPGDEIELTRHHDQRTLLVDGERSFGSIPALERAEHVVRARRVQGELWEVEVDPL